MSKTRGATFVHAAEPLRPQSDALAGVFLALDVAALAAVLLAWDFVGPWVEGAFHWATGQPPLHADWRDMLDYSYAMLWQLPLIGCLVSWLAIRSKSHRLALMAAALPVLLFALTFGWYNLAPPDLR